MSAIVKRVLKTHYRVFESIYKRQLTNGGRRNYNFGLVVCVTGNPAWRRVDNKACPLQFYSSSTQTIKKQIIVPHMGDSITEGTLEKFLKLPGDKVKVDEIVALIETDKVTLDVRSKDAGEIRELKVSEGDSVKVGQEIMSYVPCLVEDTTKQEDIFAVSKVEDIPPNVFIIVPTMGDSVSEGVIATLSSTPGKYVKKDELIAQIETDKVTIDVRSPEDGLLTKYTVQEGETVCAADVIAEIQPASGAHVDLTEAEVSSGKFSSSTPASSIQNSVPNKSQIHSPGEHRVKMSRLRMRVSERLKSAQNTYAMLTTFNEIDMTKVIDVRRKYGVEFQREYGVKLGFMSFFVAATARALHEQKTVNAVIEGDEIVYKNYVDISVAVSSPKGLVVPVLRSADKMSFSEIESQINTLAKKAAEGTLSIDQMIGGTFTISNGGTFGSLSGTPIINPPQSAILGMHSIVHRPVCIGSENIISARPMMNIALTYDHRLIDGREAVSFLKCIKESVEDPVQMLIKLDQLKE